MEDARYNFEVEWLDAQAELVRKYSLTYFVRASGANEIEMNNLQSGKKFLKRCPYPSLRLSDLFVGAKVVVFARQLTVSAYLDDTTRKVFSAKRSRSFLLVKPDAARSVGKILQALAAAGITVAKAAMLQLSREDAAAIMTHSPDASSSTSPSSSASAAAAPASASSAAAAAAAAALAAPSRSALDHATSDVSVAIEVVGDDAVNALQTLCGPEDPAVAQRSAPRSLRASFGKDQTRNAVFASHSPADAERAIDMCFGARRCASASAVSATFDSCTLCVIKPHAVREGLAGRIVDDVLTQGFEVSALQMFSLDRPSATEFLEVYKGVVPEYSALVDELCSGPCVAMEVRAEDAVPTFREFAGPMDVDIAKHIRPASLRAKYGVDKVRNAVHCTDLPEDGRLECEYFFHILHTRG